MLGAIIGDIVGSRFEFNPTNDYNFDLCTSECSYTDDTICTIAVAEALLKNRDFGESLHEWCRKYPNPKGGYGGRFREWVMSDDPQPYNSFGNGSAMRVSPIGWRYRNFHGAIPAAERCASCTDNHPEGIKGAQAVVAAIHYGDELRRTGEKIDKDSIVKAFQPIIKATGYNINIRRENVLNKFDETCQGTVPVALWIVTESTGFEDAIRKAVSLGADADTLGAIVGSIAEAIWGIPSDIAYRFFRMIPEDMQIIVERFYQRFRPEVFPLKGYGDEGAALDLLADDEPELYKEIMEEKEEEAMMKQQCAIMRWKLGLGTLNGFLEGRDGLPKKDVVATADSWKTEAMPDDEDDFSIIDYTENYSLEDLEILKKGHIPEVQEDHWFMYCTDDCIRYYRSWTGMCAFEAYYHVDEELNMMIFDKIIVNRNLVQFGVNGDQPAVALFRYLIDAECGHFDAENSWEAYICEWKLEHKKNDVRAAKKMAREKRKKAYEEETGAFVEFQTSRVAGAHYVKDKSLLCKLQQYDKIELARECDNEYDKNAVALMFDGKRIGYVPRRENKALASMLEAGMAKRIVTFVTSIKDNDYENFEFTVYLKPEENDFKHEVEDTIYFWAGKMIEHLESMPYGTEISTSGLFVITSEKYAEEHEIEVHTPDEWKLHDIFMALARKEGFRVYSGTEGEMGLPFAIPMIFKKKRK